MIQWLADLEGLGEAPCVLVTVARAEGSVPREAGTKMIVTREQQFGTVGGGHLELKSVELARALLAKADAAPACYRFPLGPSLGQCCGGAASLVLERIAFPRPEWIGELAARVRQGDSAVLVTRIGEAIGAIGQRVFHWPAGEEGAGESRPFDAPGQAAVETLVERGEAAALVQDRSGLALFERVGPAGFHVMLFGAGHVGQALVRVLSGLPCRITWVDSRDAQFPAEVPGNVRIEHSDAPEEEVAAAGAGTCFLVMTHSHALDQAICERILRRGDFRYFGLIGSKTKRALFGRRLQERGISADALARMVCPIGIPGVAGKEPGVIAVAVAAQLLLLLRQDSVRASVDADTSLK